ncbi:MAG TPA: hypothetical protein VK636_17750, partial [Gemmatimonadaceae bacterium]|nr:hypothetical protein [Gemmatimonadaceae bacterium]
KRLELSSEMLSALQHTLAFRPTSRGAFVARSALQLHTAREFTRMGEPDGQAVRTFRSAVAAETWLRKA